MKNSLIAYISLFLMFVVGCKSQQTSSAKQNDITISTDEREEEDKVFRRQTFEAFNNLDEVKAKEREEQYLLMLEQFEESKDSDANWYKRNIVHIDSIARYCIELSENDRKEELLNVLASELWNFQSHPNADTYLCFDMNCILTKLYFEQSDNHPDYLQKCIDLWELNRVQINAVQSSWQEYHPLYIEILNILLNLYEKAENPQKVAEMQGLINEVTVP